MSTISERLRQCARTSNYECNINCTDTMYRAHDTIDALVAALEEARGYIGDDDVLAQADAALALARKA